MPLNILSKKVWYQKGLRFKCTECGACCTKAPGYVWLTQNDIKILSKYLNLSEGDFLQKYTRKVKNRISLLEDPKTFDCVFLQGKKCSVYTARPKQCQTYPFWSSILKDPKTWEEEKKHCEGITDSAPLVSFEEIEKKRTLSEES